LGGARRRCVAARQFGPGRLGQTYQSAADTSWDECGNAGVELAEIEGQIAELRGRLESHPAAAAVAPPEPRQATCRCAGGSSIPVASPGDCAVFCLSLGKDMLGIDPPE
jgi:hypothetical protein